VRWGQAKLELAVRGVPGDNKRSSLSMETAQPGYLGLCRLPPTRRRWPHDIDDSSTQASHPGRAIYVVTRHRAGPAASSGTKNAVLCQRTFLFVNESCSSGIFCH